MSTSPIKRAEILAGISLAADSGMGHPGDLGLRSCLVALEIAKLAGLSASDTADVFHLSLLRFAGCTGDAHIAADVWGDEVHARGWLAFSDFGNPMDVMSRVAKNVGVHEGMFTRARLIGRAFAKMSALYGTSVSHCEVAGQIAVRIGLDERVRARLQQVFERWDGKGIPNGLVRDATALPVRVSNLAHDAALFFAAGGADAMVDVVERRTGGAHEPDLARIVTTESSRLAAVLEKASPWDAVVERDPSGPLAN